MNLRLRSFVKPLSKLDQLIESLGLITICDLVDADITRGKRNRILKVIPLNLRPLFIDEFDYERPRRMLDIGGKIRDLERLSGSQIQQALKRVLKKVKIYDVGLNLMGERGDQIIEAQTWSNLQKIKNPILQGIRYKVLYKNIFSNDRRFRFGLTTSPLCLICGLKETVEHQLFQCVNARRLWNIYERTFRTKCQSFYEEVNVTKDKLKEIFKTVILKSLIQIDRSQHIDEAMFTNKLLFYIEIELRATKNVLYKNFLESQFWGT